MRPSRCPSLSVQVNDSASSFISSPSHPAHHHRLFSSVSFRDLDLLVEISTQKIQFRRLQNIVRIWSRKDFKSQLPQLLLVEPYKPLGGEYTLNRRRLYVQLIHFHAITFMSCWNLVNIRRHLSLYLSVSFPHILLRVQTNVAIFNEAFSDAQRSQFVHYKCEILLITLSFLIASWDAWGNSGVNYWYRLFPGYWSLRTLHHPRSLFIISEQTHISKDPFQPKSLLCTTFLSLWKLSFLSFSSNPSFSHEDTPTLSSLSCHFLLGKEIWFPPKSRVLR